MSNQGALAEFDDDAAIAAIASGKLMHQLGSEAGCSKVAIRKRLINHPDYKQAIVSQAESLVEQATFEAMTCDSDSVNIARVRVDAAHKWARARDPTNWGDKQQLVIDHRVTVDHTLNDDAMALLGKLRVQRTIEHE